MRSSWMLVPVVVAAALAAAPLPPLAAPPERFTVRSDGHPMAVWARAPAAPKGVVLLVHGRTWSSLPDFDLEVPGLERSVMSSLAARGFAAYAVDLRGYGATPRDSSGWMTPRRSASDVMNVLTWVMARHPRLSPPALIGWSRGAMIGQMVAQVAPARVSALVLFGFAYDPDASFVDAALPAQPAREKNTPASAMADFISPAVTPRAVVQAFSDQALRSDPVLVDVRGDAEFNDLSPDKVTVPTLVVFGDRDPGVLQADAGKFFARLATPDKQMVVLPGADHAAQLEDTHDAWIAAVTAFLTRPGVLMPRPAAEQDADDLEFPGTFSILGYDARTGEVGGAVQSRVFSVGNGVLWAEAGAGVVATQAIVDVSYGPQAIELLRQGMAPKQIITTIWNRDPDPDPDRWTKEGRQFAVMNAKGEMAAYTGPRASVWAGDRQGRHVTAQGNILAGEAVVADMVAAFEKTEFDETGAPVHLSLRLQAALEAGDAAGGDTRGKQSAAMVVVKKGCGVWLNNDVVVRLQVDDNPEPIVELRRLLEIAARQRRAIARSKPEC